MSLPHIEYNAAVGYYSVASAVVDDVEIYSLVYTIVPKEKEDEFLDRLIQTNLLDFLRRYPINMYPLQNKKQMVGDPVVMNKNEVAAEKFDHLFARAKELNAQILGW